MYAYRTFLCRSVLSKVCSAEQVVFRGTLGFRQKLQGFRIKNLEKFKIARVFKILMAYYDSYTIILIYTYNQIHDMQIELMFIYF